MTGPGMTNPADPGGMTPPGAASAPTRSGLSRVPWQALLLVAGGIWGCSFLFMKLGLQSFTPIQVGFGRLAIGAATLLLLCRVTGTRLPRGPIWRHLAVTGLLFGSIPFVLFAYGETRVSSILAGIINAATPLTTLAATLVAFREERPTPDRMAGLLVGFAGILVVLGAWNGIGGGELPGVLACVGAIVCYGIAYPYSRRHIIPAGPGPLAIATGQVVMSAALLVPVAAGEVLLGGGAIRLPIAIDTALGMLALGALGSGVAYALNTQVIAVVGAAVASSVTYVTPFVAVVAGVLFLAEPVSANEPAGALVVLLGVAIAQGRIRRPRRAPVSAAA